MYNKNLYALLIFFFTLTLTTAQESFERLYRSPGDGHLATSVDVVGDGYVVLSGQPNDEGTYDKLNLTTFNVKGNVGWSQEYTFRDTLKIADIGDVISLESGNILFTAILEKDSLNKVLTLVNGEGNVIWSRLTGKMTDIRRAIEEKSLLQELPSLKVVHTHRVLSSDDTRVILMTILDEENMIASERELSIAAGINVQVEDMILSSDSTLLVLASSTLDTMPILLTRMDTLGNVIWSRSYDIQVDQPVDDRGLYLTELGDRRIVVVGGLKGQGLQARRGFVLSLDATGETMKTEMIVPNTTTRDIYPSGVVTVDDTLVVMAIKQTNATDVLTTLIKYNLDSLVLYESQLDTTVAEHIYRGALVTVDSSSVTYLTSTRYEEFDNMAPFLAKATNAGVTPCYEPTMIYSFDSIGVTQSTFAWSILDSEVNDSIPVNALTYGAFDPPLLMMPDTVYCPNDPINFRVNAAVRGGVAYLWDDGNTDSVRVFTEEGEFKLTVTVGIEECFTLCDTTTITVMDEPTVAIAKVSQYCENGMMLLQAQGMGMLRSILWSNGSTESFILVDQPGSYSVTVEDVCGIIVDDEVSVTDADLSGSTPLNINVSGPDLCADGTILLTATGTQDVANLQWSTGVSAVQSISVSAPGTYTVSYNSMFCPGEESITLTEDDFDVTPSGEIRGTCNASQTAYILTVVGTNIIRREWQDGSAGTSLSVNTPGEYSVTLTGPCGDQEVISITVTEDEISDCIINNIEECLRFPNVFIPTDQEDINKTFGPKVDCPVDNYELNIYNRWGEKIWNTSNVTTRWDGNLDGSAAPGGVYFWWARYGEESNQVIVEGDVTLLR